VLLCADVCVCVHVADLELGIWLVCSFMAACGFDCDDSIVRIRVFGCQCVNERAERVVFFFFACIACVTCWARANCMEVPIWVIYCCLKSNDTLENAKKVVMIGGKMCFISEYCECGSLDKLHRVKDLASPKRFCTHPHVHRSSRYCVYLLFTEAGVCESKHFS